MVVTVAPYISGCPNMVLAMQRVFPINSVCKQYTGPQNMETDAAYLLHIFAVTNKTISIWEMQ